MVSMKLDPSKQDPSDAGATAPMMSDPPAYPYGLVLRLEEEQLAALGIKTLPQAGTKVRITAVADVCGVHQEAEADGTVDRCVSLQITDMDPPKAANSMYPNSNMNP